MFSLGLVRFAYFILPAIKLVAVLIVKEVDGVADLGECGAF